ncbi:MAG: class I SAM-dependent methyltransferase [Saprospiraceae bacterium]
MGLQKLINEIWGQIPENWATIQEITGESVYQHLCKFIDFTPCNKLLDVGSGSGYFSNLMEEDGLTVTGIDTNTRLVELAKKRTSEVEFLTGEMEDLPFPDNTFDTVCAFNAIQYAESPECVILECKRVLKAKGKLFFMIWGDEKDCEASSFLNAVGGLMLPYPSGTESFALSKNRRLESIIKACGLKIIDNSNIASVWDYPNAETALKGLLSAGPIVKAIEHSGFDKVYEESIASISTYTQEDGRIVYKNKFRVVICSK